MWGIQKFGQGEGLSPASCNSFSLNANYAFQNNTLIIFWLKKSLGSAHVSSKIKLIMMHAMLQIPLQDIKICVHSLCGDMTLRITWEKRPTPTSSESFCSSDVRDLSKHKDTSGPNFSFLTPPMLFLSDIFPCILHS